MFSTILNEAFKTDTTHLHMSGSDDAFQTIQANKLFLQSDLAFHYSRIFTLFQYDPHCTRDYNFPECLRKEKRVVRRSVIISIFEILSCKVGTTLYFPEFSFCPSIRSYGLDADALRAYVPPRTSWVRR